MSPFPLIKQNNQNIRYIPSVSRNVVVSFFNIMKVLLFLAMVSLSLNSVIMVVTATTTETSLHVPGFAFHRYHHHRHYSHNARMMENKNGFCQISKNGIATLTATSTTTTRRSTTELFFANKASDGANNNNNNNNDKQRKVQKKKKKIIISNNKQQKNNDSNDINTTASDDEEIWRIYGITIHPDELADKDKSSSSSSSLLSSPHPRRRVIEEEEVTNETSTVYRLLQEGISQKLLSAKMKTKKQSKEGTSSSSSLTSSSKNNANYKFQVVRCSLDARKKVPLFSYILDVTLPKTMTRGWISQRGRLIKVDHQQQKQEHEEVENASNNNHEKKKKVIIVGAGPAGLFCALQLLQQTKDIDIVLLDRGQPVEQRGRDIGALIHRRTLNMESNFAFGEGGAGTWSDGKLTTRTGRNSQLVRMVFETLVRFGAPSTILWDGSPHLGTDNLVRLLRNMRQYILQDKQNDGQREVLFGTKMTDLILCEEEKTGVVKGIKVSHPDGTTSEIRGDAVVLATGHSARDIYECLHKSGHPVQLEAKGFAVGFRIEHPQALINDIQYGKEWGPSVQTGRAKTDALNLEYFGETIETKQHPGRLPVPSYRLATDKAEDGVESSSTRGVYSFCMCPGGQIVPSSTDPNELCINGMSFSRRDSIWANSALVVTVSPDDAVLQDYRSKYGILAGVEFQRDMERRAAVMGGGNWTVPVQRVTDFIKGAVSKTVPTSSYRLGVKSAPCHEIYPSPITNALRDALLNYFEKQMPGYCHPDALLHGVETRTSSPLRIARDRDTFQAIGTENLFPAGEGAGFAGGIVSAAVDGATVAEAVLDNLFGTSREGRLEKVQSEGFSY